MAAGIIQVASIPGWPNNVPAGLAEACENALEAAGFSPKYVVHPDGIHVSDVPTVNNVFATYVGGADELNHHKTLKQAELDAFFDQFFDFDQFIRTGTATSVTATQVGNFLAQITNNYRTLRASIKNASSVAVVEAINVQSGWPNNP
jgi:hypothetical protein